MVQITYLLFTDLYPSAQILVDLTKRSMVGLTLPSYLADDIIPICAPFRRYLVPFA